MVAPPIQDVIAHATCRVVVSEGHAEGGVAGRPERAARGTCVSKEAGVAVSQAPAPCVRQASKADDCA